MIAHFRERQRDTETETETTATKKSKSIRRLVVNNELLNVNQGTRTCDMWTHRVPHEGDGGALAMYGVAVGGK